MSRPPIRLSRLAVRFLAGLFVCSALVVSGCSSYDEPAGYGGSSNSPRAAAPRTSNAQTSSPAVQASQVTHVPQQDQQRQGRFTMAYPTGDRNTSTLLIEQNGPDEVRVGHDYSYQVRVTNLTSMPVRNVTLTAQQPDGFRVTRIGSPTTQPVGAEPTTQPSSNGQIVLNVGDLGPKQSQTMEITGVPDRVGTVDTCYAVTYQPPTLCTMVRVVNPSLQVTAQGPQETDVCQDIIYHYTVANTGTGTARGVTLQANLPDGLTTTDGRNVVSANLGDIPQGQSRDVTAHLHAAHGGNFTTEAVAKSQDDQTQAATVATAVHEPKLTVAVKGPEQDYVNSQITYQVTVTNTGDAPARNTLVQASSSNAGHIVAMNSVEGQQGEARVAAGRNSPNGETLGTLAPGESRTLNVIAEGSQGGDLTLTANANAACAQRVAAQATTRIQTIPALLLEAVDETDPVRVGNEVVYDIKVTNQGTGPDQNIKVTATLPDGEEFVRATGATQATANGQEITFAPVDTLGPKQSVTWKVVARAARAGDVRFKVTATSNSLSSPAEKVEPTKLY